MSDKSFSELKNAIFDYREEYAKELVESLISKDVNALGILNVLTEAISEIGEKFEKEELFLPDLMLGAKTMKIAMQPLEVEITKKGLQRKTEGKVVIGTVFGDLHDIGKGIVATLLEANGFEVIDLGVNVEAKKFLDAIDKHNPEILAMSALLTTTASEMGRVIKKLIQDGTRSNVKIIIGGGPITEDFAKNIGADGYEPTAPLAVKLAKKLVHNMH
jgi:5-methyltetrahydrofolate--homocysteine methyltransferase